MVLPRVLLGFLYVLVAAVHVCTVTAAQEQTSKKSAKKKKDLTDYTDADLERLFDEWEENDEPLEEDELPEWKRKPPPIDLNGIDSSDPEKLLAASKKGRSLMVFVTVSGKPSERETEQITGLWQTSLHNAHFDVQKYLVDDNRVIFMFKDGSRAWEGKDFLIKQDRCQEVTIEGKSYPGTTTKSKTEL